MIYTLQLPKPSDQLIKLIKLIALNRPINIESKKWHDDLQNNKINCGAGDFFSDKIITDFTKKEFQHIFKKEIYPTIGIIHNLNSNNTASYPPHTDRVRTLSINYYIDLGGDNVSTIFYDKQDPTDDQVGGHVLPYNEVKAQSKYIFDTDTWYLLNSRKFHSVENIKTSRIVFGISFLNTSTEEFFEMLGGECGIRTHAPIAE